MKTLFRPLSLALLCPLLIVLVSCAEHLSHIQPVDLSGIAGGITKASTVDADAILKSKQVVAAGTVAQSPLSLSLEQDTEKIKDILDQTQAQLKLDEVKIDKVTAQANNIEDKYSELKLSDAKKSTRILELWIALGLLVVCDIGFFVARQYIPFLKLI